MVTQQQKYAPAEAQAIPQIIDQWLTTADSSKDVKSRWAQERAYIKRNRNAIVSVFKELNLVGGELGAFLLIRSDDGQPSSIPVNIVEWNQQRTLLITGVALLTVYNTLKSSTKQRAALVISSAILSSLKAFTRADLPSDLKHIGMAVVFGSKDFSNPSSVLNLKPEMVALITPLDIAKRFVEEGSITQEQLVAASAVFMADRDMVTGVKRISVTLA